MIDNEFFLNNDNFIIDEEFYKEFFSTYRIKKYKVCDIPVESIRMRQRDGGYIKAKDSELCRSLLNNRIEGVSEEEYLYTKKLIDNIEQNGYDKRKIIIVNEFNMLIDGQHRLYYFIVKNNVSKVRVLKLYLYREGTLKKIIKLLQSKIKKLYV